MRQINKKTIKQILEIPEKELVNIIVYNLGRGAEYRNFENWFDNKEKLDYSSIYDCKTGLKFDWASYGNLSKAKSYVDFLGTDFDYNEPIKESIDGGRKMPQEVDVNVRTLGSYRRMQSPGRITLNIDNIQISFWSIIFKLICDKGYTFTREKIEELAKLSIYKTLYHELFHHFIDVQSYLSKDYSYDFEVDEALAVAFSRLLVGYETKFNHTYISDFLELSYSYKLRGYRDWVNYKAEEQFVLKVIDYIKIDKKLIFKGQQITPIVDALMYSIVENPNVVVHVN